MITEVKNIINIKKGKKPKLTVTTAENDCLPYVDIKAFEKGIIENYTNDEKCLSCEDGDLLIVCDGSRSGLVGKAIKGYVGSTLARIDLDSSVDRDYMFYFIQGKYALLNTQKKGTGTPHLNATLLKESSIYLPDIPTQQRIVTRIENFFIPLDNIVEKMKKSKQQLVVYRQALLKEVFECCPNRVTVDSVCTYVTDGDHQPPPKSEFGIPFIMISNIENNKINWDNTAFVGQDYYASLSDKRCPQKGDVLYTVTGSFGIPVIVDFDKQFCFQRHIALLRPNEKILPKFLFYALQEPSVYMQARDKSTGTAQKTVGLAVLRKINIPFVDSIQEQQDIVHYIESCFSSCDSIEKIIDENLQKLEKIKQGILKKAFEGDLI